MIIDATFAITPIIDAEFGTLAKGDKGDALTYDDLTEEQKAELGNTEKVDNHEKRITNLEHKIAPEYFLTDADVAHQKIVPSNACPFALVSKVGGMNVKTDDDNLLSVKPLSLKSRWANLFDIYRTDFVAVNEFTLNNYLPKSENGVMYSGGVNGKSAGACLPIYLKPNTDYYISFDASCNASTETEITIQLLLIPNIENSTFLESGIKKQAEFRTQGHYGLTFNSGNYTAFGIRAYSNNRYGIEFRNVNLHYGTTEAPYKPYSAEPIDTFALPEAIQALDGWGLGIDAEYNDHIVWRNGRVVYVQKVSTKSFNGTESFWLNSHLNNSGVMAYQMDFTSLSGVAPLSNLFKGMTWVGGRKNYTVQNVSGNSLVFITDGVQTLDEFKAYLAEQYNSGNPVTVVYALATPIETDITHLFTSTEAFLEVECGGYIEAVNEFGQAAPSEITYMLKEGN